MKVNNRKKIFGDAVDLLMGDMEELKVPRGVEMLNISEIQPFHDHPFHLYEGERLDDMVSSVKTHGILNPVIVLKITEGYEMLSGHNRMQAAQLAGLKQIPAIVKKDLSEEEAYVYVIETNLMQRSFSDLAISEKAAVLKARYEKGSCQGKRNDILNEISKLEGKSVKVTSGQADQKLTTRDIIGKEYELSGSSVGRLLKYNDLIKPFKDMLDASVL
ncbi:MAG: ParB/RepB/Spo0J family partition protein [Blautia sp.]|uniref:ParB N-terminal domain-containing protein n=1 Tax=Blautia sp. TaxID=1955243 RepID=UPI002A83D630|nr:ParB/RepB/Spo0J family partition protein [Blautia sp.]MDY4116073.1 ParB/RepB/Spo0J family partition protein [Blautia sp.]